MVLEIINSAAQDKNLYSPKIRFRLMAASCFILLCSFFSLVFFREISVKIPALYIITGSAMYLIILYKNSFSKYEAGIFFFLFIQLLALAPKFNDLTSELASTFLLSFRYGVSSRSFQGTIIDFLSNGSFVSKYFVWHFIFCSLLFFIFLIAVFLNSVIKKSKDNTKSMVLFLSILLLTCFVSPATYFAPHNFGRSEVFALIFTLLSIAVIDKPYIKWVIPFFALFILSTHLIFIFFYIPFIFILLFYKLDGQKNRKEYIALFFTSFAVIITSFILYILFHKQTFVFPNAEAFAEYLRTKTNINFSNDYIHSIFFADLKDHLLGRDERMAKGFLKFSGNISIIINFPLILMFAHFWIKCFLHEKQQFMKLFFALPVLLFIYHIPVFFIFFDFGRWMAMIIQVQLLLVFYLIYTENKTALFVTEKIVPVINRNWYPIIIACSLMLFLGPARELPSSRVRHIIDGFLLFFFNTSF